MIIIGVTGSMAMGKSLVCRVFKTSFRVPVWDADQTVRRLLVTNQALKNRIQAAFPQVVQDGKVNRLSLREIVFSNPSDLKRLEEIVIPEVLKEMNKFLQKMANFNQPICVVDVPLLFELGWDSFCTYTLTVSAHPFVQRERILKRLKMTEAQMNVVLLCQMSDVEKRRRSDFVVQTGLSKMYVYEQVAHIFRKLTEDA